jgi:predicted dehydrogenase
MTIKIAIAGAGYIAGIHAQALRANGAEIAAVVDVFADKAAAFANQYHIPHHYTSLDALFAAARPGELPQALVIGTPNYLHMPQAVAALNAGIHVLVEKPMAMNAVQAQQMADLAQSTGALLMVAHCWRFDQEVRWLKSQAQRLGRIFRTKGYGVHTHWGPTGWFTQKQAAGGGALADMGIHALDTARFLLDDPLPLSVYARIATHYGSYDVDDTGVLIVNWDNGASSYIESGWWQPHSDGPEAATQLYAAHGFGSLFPTYLELPAAEKLEVIDPGFVFPRPEHCPQEMYDLQMAYFLDCIRTAKTPNPGSAEGLVNMKIIDAAYQSAQTGQVVQIGA